MLWSVTERIEIQYLNRYARGPICSGTMTYLRVLAAVLLPEKNEGVTQIAIIEGNHPNNVQLCFMDFVKVWREQKEGTWKELIDALEKTGRQQLATEIKSLLIPDSSTISLSSAQQSQQNNQRQASTTQNKVLAQMQINSQGDDEGICILATIFLHICIIFIISS